MTTTRRRLDSELVRRGLAPSREAAAAVVAAGRVLVSGRVAGKPATLVAPSDPVVLTAPPRPYASRGGEKLAPALDRLGVTVEGRRCLDAGASTGGFTDVLLTRGAAEVHAVDVGYGQLAARLAADDRVRVHDRTNVRHLTPDDIGGPVDLVVADLSFISLTTVLPALAAAARPDADLVLLVKPQFEVGRAETAAGRGVVRDPALWVSAIRKVAAAAATPGLPGGPLGVAGLCPSEKPGPAGNVEFFLHLRRGAGALPDPAVDAAVVEGADLARRVSAQPAQEPGAAQDPQRESDAHPAQGEDYADAGRTEHHAQDAHRRSAQHAEDTRKARGAWGRRHG